MGKVDFGSLVDGVDDPVFGEPRSGDRAERSIIAFASAEQQLVILGALLIDSENANVTGMVVPASVDAARKLEQQCTQIGLLGSKPF